MKINEKFQPKQIVYLVTDPDQCLRIITGIVVRPDGLKYLVSCGEEESEHYDFEITEDKNYKS